MDFRYGVTVKLSLHVIKDDSFIRLFASQVLTSSNSDMGRSVYDGT